MMMLLIFKSPNLTSNGLIHFGIKVRPGDEKEKKLFRHRFGISIRESMFMYNENIDFAWGSKAESLFGKRAEKIDKTGN